MAGLAGPSLQTTPTARLELRQSLRAGLQQGMAMLALPAVDLHAELQRHAERNPFLLLERSQAFAGTGDFDSAQLVAAQPSLADHLHTQIVCMTLPPPVRALSLFLASDLDERGLLPDPDPEIATELGVPEADVRAARSALQGCEPCGIGARDVREAVALQLVDAGYDTEFAHAAMGELQAFAEERWNDLTVALGLSLDAVKQLAQDIRLCTPDPASAFAPGEARPLIPELSVERSTDGDLHVRLLDDPSLAVRFDEGLRTQIQQSGQRATGALGQNSQVAARRLITSLQFRSNTLLRVGLAMAQAQSRFFLGHVRLPEPLARATIAQDLGLHPATVGRAVKGRGVLFGGRVEPMSWFFPKGIESGDSPLSQPEIMARVRDIVSAETAETVLNDDAIAERLQKDGVDIARRTVAKYRKCLRIPPSPKRRRLLLQKIGDAEAPRGR